MIRFSTVGESHGEALIALVQGMPAGVTVDLDFVNRDESSMSGREWGHVDSRLLVTQPKRGVY